MLIYSVAIIAIALLTISVIWNFRLFCKINKHVTLKGKHHKIKENIFSQVNIIDHIHDSVISTDLEGFVSTWNKGSEKLFGYHSDEIIGRHISILYPQQSQEYLRNELIPALVKKGSHEVEVELLHKNGKSFYAHLSLSMIYDKQKKAIGMVGYSMDITEKRNTNETLKKFKHTLDQTLDCVFMFDAESLKFNYVNEGASKQVGYSYEEMLNMHPYDIKPEYNETEFREIISPLLKNKQSSINFETIHQSKDNLFIPVEVFLQYIVLEDTRPHFIAIIRDISERKASEKALQESELFLEKAQQIASIGHWKLTLETNEVWASTELYNILGFDPRKNITIESFMNTIHPDDKSKVLASLQHGIKGGERNTEYRLIDANGKTKWLHGIGGATKNSAGKVVEVFGTIQDITKSKQIEESLKESEDLLERAQTLTKIGHWKLDPATEEVTGSDELFRILCLSRDFSTLESFIDIIHPDDREMEMEAIQRGKDYGESWDLKYRLLDCNSKEKWVHAIADAIKDEQGNVIELIGTVQDITQQKHAEDEAEKSRARFELMFESIPDAVIFVDTDNNIKMLNRAFSIIFGYEKSEVLGKSFANLHTAPDDSRQINSCLKLGEQTYQLNYQTKNGKFITGETISSPLIDAEEKTLGQLVIIRDVSERSQVDSILHSLAAAGTGLQFDVFMHDVLERLTELYNCQYAFIGQTLPDGLHVRTLAGRANGKVIDNFEYALLDTPCEDIITRKKSIIPESASTIYAKDQMLVDMGVESYFGAPLITSDGSIIGMLSVMGTQRLELDNWTEPVLGVFATRISLELERELATQELQLHRQHLEELVNERTLDLSHARDEAEQANAAKSEFLSQMSHELRTPLNAILGFAQILELDAENFNKEQQIDIQEILDAGRHLLTLINEVLDLSKIESGKLVVSEQQFAVEELLQQCVSLIAPQAKARQIKLTNNACTEKHIVQADTTRLKQVLLNLLSNAVKYNQQAGQITINNSLVNNRHLRISITDTGNGLTEEEISHLFTAFNRLNAPENIEGTGIGLHISKRLIELMNGAMGVESTPGKGSTFWLELRLADSEIKINE